MHECPECACGCTCESGELDAADCGCDCIECGCDDLDDDGQPDELTEWHDYDPEC